MDICSDLGAPSYFFFFTQINHLLDRDLLLSAVRRDIGGPLSRLVLLLSPLSTQTSSFLSFLRTTRKSLLASSALLS